MSSVTPLRWLARLFARTADTPPTTEYHAVSIRCGKTACQAAQDRVGKRHLSSETPFLPLDQCDRPDQCDCRYQHYDDRRAESRRRSDHGLSDQRDPEHIERRYKKDRRAQDDVQQDEPFSVHEDSYYEHIGDTVRTAMIDTSEADGVDPYNSGSFDKSKSWEPGSGK